MDSVFMVCPLQKLCGRGQAVQNHINFFKEEKKMRTLIGFLKDEEGVSAIEYGLIASLIAVALIVGATALGTKLNSLFTTTAGKMAGGS